MAQNESFIYRRLGHRQIRLITLLPGEDPEKIRCTLHHTSLDSKPNFEALSYVWGSDDLYASILIDGRSFNVRRNLWFALYHFRGSRKTTGRDLRKDEVPVATSQPCEDIQKYPREYEDVSPLATSPEPQNSSQPAFEIRPSGTTREWRTGASDSTLPAGETLTHEPLDVKEALTIWIDAICINQDDNLERSAQVQIMGSIYQTAKRLRIWLGEHSPNTIAAIENFSVADMRTKMFLDDPWGWKLDIESISASVYGGPMESFFDYLIDFLSQREIDEATVTDSRDLQDLVLAWRRLKDEWVKPDDDGPPKENLISIRDLSKRVRSICNDALLLLNLELNLEKGLLAYIIDLKKAEYIISKILNTIKTKYSGGDSFQSPIHRRSRKGILEICRSPYWTRLWVIQEAVLGSAPIIYCGASTLSWAKFGEFLNATFQKGLQNINTENIPGYYLSPRLAVEIQSTPAVEFLKSFQVTKSAGIGRCSLRSLITAFCKAQAKDPRDMVYGLLALSTSSRSANFTPDYNKPTHELYVEVLKASMRRRSSPWSGPDQYLVSFSHLLQQVFGDAFWDRNCNRPLRMKSCVPGSYDLDEMLIVGGILGKRIVWGRCLALPLDGSSAESMLGESEAQETDLLTPQLTPKDVAWLGHVSPSKDKHIAHINSSAAAAIASISSRKSPAIFHQTFIARQYFDNTTLVGNALLSTPHGYGECLCLFKDCEVAAIVREKSPGIYFITGHAIVDRTPLKPLEKWTMECDVAMTFEELQMLTM